MDVSCPIKTFLFQETDLLAFALISYRTALSSSMTELNQLRDGGRWGGGQGAVFPRSSYRPSHLGLCALSPALLSSFESLVGS